MRTAAPETTLELGGGKRGTRRKRKGGDNHP